MIERSTRRAKDDELQARLDAIVLAWCLAMRALDKARP